MNGKSQRRTQNKRRITSLIQDRAIVDKLSTPDLFTALETLPERQRETMMLLFGLEDGYAHTFRSIRLRLGLSPWRVQQLINKALHKIATWVRADTIKTDHLSALNMQRHG